MTLAALWSRQGKLVLALAFLAATVALVGASLWSADSARADIPAGTTVTLTQIDPTTGNVDIGDMGACAGANCVTYHVDIRTIAAATGTTSGASFEIQPDPNLWFIGVANRTGAWAATTCLPQGGNLENDVKCTSGAAIDDGTFDLTFVAIPYKDFDIGSPLTAGAACELDDAGANGPQNCIESPNAAAFNLTINPWLIAPLNTPTPENGPGQDHTIVFTLPNNITCVSSFSAPPIDQAGTPGSHPGGTAATRACAAGDVGIAGTAGATLVSGPTVVGSSLSSPGTVTVVINSPTTGTADVTLNVAFVTNIGATPPAGAGPNSYDLIDPVAHKIYGIVAAGSEGVVRHVDLADKATEDAANIDSYQPYCADVLAALATPGVAALGSTTPSPTPNAVLGSNCGVLSGQDDVDDAIGSFHGACLLGTLLTYSQNKGDLTWHIEPVGGGPIAAGVKTFAGQNDEPCVMWGAGTTGTQQIFVVYHEGLADEQTFYWDNDPSLPLIKEWNTIDFTKIIGSTGDVGDTLGDNTGGLSNWSSRDCVDSSGICGNANLNGTTWDVSGVTFPLAGPDCPPFSGGCISANGPSFIDYTMGHHADAGGAYNGPVDGAAQTYSVSGDCGSVRLENPTTGDVILLAPDGSLDGSSASVLSSDKGVGFQVVPNATGAIATTMTNANCQADSCITVTIDTQEDNLFHSPPLAEADQEVITVCFHVGPPTNKQPLLAWAGQRVVLEHDWSFTDVNGSRSCPFGSGDFFVRYLKESGNGGFVSDFGRGAATGPDFMVVRTSGSGDSDTDPEADCISRVMYEAQDQGEQDVVAHVVFCELIRDLNASVQGGPSGIDPDTCSVASEQVAFLVYYMKFEDITLKLIPGETTHNPLTSQESTAIGAPAGADTTTANVSANVLARATVRGWTLTDNCPAANVAKTGSNGEALPANRCIFPDDWLFKAGGNASDVRKNYDNYGGSTGGCSNVAGPYSLLDPVVFDSSGDRDIVCGDSMAPHAPFGDGHRETNFPNGVTDANDAPMPSALIRFLLTGSGFLLGTTKSNPTTQFNVTHIPAEPWIAPINADGSGYQWNSWGAGPKSGVYNYWTSFADHGPEVLSCAGSSSGVTATSGECDAAGDVGVPTGGYQLTRVYSDEHGVAMTWINGDANLTFEGCASTAAAAGHKIVLLKGFFCQPDNTVGSSTLNALADYPDKRKHFAIISSDVSITWTWGGTKNITVEPGAGPQFHYVVLHVTDRDGFCGNSPSLHPVLGEPVEFVIDSDAGLIVPNVNGDAAAAPGGTSTVSDHGKSASTTTFDTAAHASIASGGWTVEPVQVTGECQAWIHVSESQLQNVDVIVTAFDPEGTVTFDTTDINPTPTPSPSPTEVPPTPTPVPTHTVTWGDWNCSGAVNGGDAVNVDRKLVSLPVSPTPTGFCPTMGTSYAVSQDGLTQNRVWGDTDCSGTITGADAIKIDRALVDLPFESFASCPGLKQVVTIPAS